MSRAFKESVVEGVAVAWPGALGSSVLHKPDIAVRDGGAECRDPNCRDVILKRQLRDALLPKLISGELRVREAGTFLTEVEP